MFVISTKNQHEETTNLATAESLNKAKSFVEIEFNLAANEPVWQTDEQGRAIYILDDTMYVIEPLKHIS